MKELNSKMLSMNTENNDLVGKLTKLGSNTRSITNPINPIPGKYVYNVEKHKIISNNKPLTAIQNASFKEALSQQADKKKEAFMNDDTYLSKVNEKLAHLANERERVSDKAKRLEILDRLNNNNNNDDSSIDEQSQQANTAKLENNIQKIQKLYSDKSLKNLQHNNNNNNNNNN